MKILCGRYIIRRAKSIKKMLLMAKYVGDETFNRMLQIYNCRIFGICFYRGERAFNRDKRRIEKLYREATAEELNG